MPRPTRDTVMKKNQNKNPYYYELRKRNLKMAAEMQFLESKVG